MFELSAGQGSPWFPWVWGAAGLGLASLTLWQGAAWSLLEGPFRHASAAQNWWFNGVLAALLAGAGVVGFLWSRRPALPGVVRVSTEVIEGPSCDIRARPVAVKASEVTRLLKLEMDGAWELQIEAPTARIRVTRASLADRTQFDALLAAVARAATHCALEEERRVIGPTSS